MDFKPGFRLSVSDSLVVVIALGLAALGVRYSVTVACVILFVVGHFFLFCNVFRMSRKPELIWALTFVLVATTSQLLGVPSVLASALICVSMTIILVFMEARKPSYHGVFWQQFNPELRQWFTENIEYQGRDS